MTPRPFPSGKLRWALPLYRLAWVFLLPVAMIYLWRRGRSDPRYRQHLCERFASYEAFTPNPIWIHAVSLGEVRSAVPLIEAFLGRGESIVITCATPAGRQAAMDSFATQIAARQLVVIYMPFDMRWTWARFLRHFSPQYGLVMEVEFWPQMIATAQKKGLALMLCNGQYPGKSYEKDSKNNRMRLHLPRGFAGVMVKSQMMADRFNSIGCKNIAITGELRFDQPLPEALIQSAEMQKQQIARPTITFASVVDGEDDIFISAIASVFSATTSPLIVYVPRAPERFDLTAQILRGHGFRVGRRSELWGADLSGDPDLSQIDVIVGDSLGEMYFYLGLADHVVVGGGFIPAGSHNMSEALTLGKSVILGPNIHTIEYPAQEALAANVAVQVQTAQELSQSLCKVQRTQIADPAVTAFMQAHSGAVERTLDAIPRLRGTI